MINFISDMIEKVGYLGIAALMFIETLFPPIPSELIMPFAGYTALIGKLSLVGVIIAGVIGSLLGSLVLYALSVLIDNGKIESWLERHGSKLGLRLEKYFASRDWFDRNSRSSVFLGRLIPGLRSVVSIPAGMRRMHLGRFIFYSGLGTALWTTGLAVAGYLLGNQFGKVEQVIGKYGLVITVLIAGIVIWLMFFRRNKKAKSNHS